jgi:alkyl hydroperoxide reductase subunit D
MCLDAHEAELKTHGVSAQQIQAALRIAAVVNAVSRVVAGEGALAA